VEEAPDVTVVVPSHGRPQRLGNLLDALAGQTLSHLRFEAVVVHDSPEPDTETLLAGHPLATAGVLRHLTLPADSALPAAKRNLGWREARAALLAFTDDDCRPPPEWLERVVAAARRHPGAIVQGATLPDPVEAASLRARFQESQQLMPPTIWAETCNVAYPRDVLERTGGFDEALLAFEDTDLALRAREQGVSYVGDATMLTYHAVHTPSLADRLRGVTRWRDGPLAMRRHPQLRRELRLGIFWKPTHAWLPLVWLGLALALGGRRWGLGLCVPWSLEQRGRYGSSIRGHLRALPELPAYAALETGEMAVLLAASARHRTLLL